MYCSGEGILGFVTTGHFSVRVTLAGKAVLAMPVLAQDAATSSTSRIPMTVVTNITRTTALTAVCTLHYWKATVRLPEVTHTSLLSDRLWGPPSLLCDGYRVSFSAAQWLRRGVDYPPRCSVEVKEKVELYCPSGSSWPAVG